MLIIKYILKVFTNKEMNIILLKEDKYKKR